MQPLNIQLPEKLIGVFDGPADFRGARGGRGGAKTIGFGKMAILDMLKDDCPKPWQFLFCRELQRSLKDSVFSVIASQINELGVGDAFDVGREYIRRKDDKVNCLFYGLRSNIAEVKGLHGVRRTWLEEAQKASQESLTYTLPTVMRDFQDCEFWATWNPEDFDDPVHNMFVNQPRPKTRCVEINWSDNPWFPKSLNELRLYDKVHRAQEYDWIWQGKFNINPEGAVYAKWLTEAEEQGRIRSGLYDPALPVHTAWDLGYSDYTAIWWYQAGRGEVRCIDYYEANREDIQHYAEQVLGFEFSADSVTQAGRVIYKAGEPIKGLERRRSYRYAQHWGPHDAAYKLLQAGGRSIVEQLYDFGIQMGVKKAVKQQTQIQSARRTIQQCYFDKDLCTDGLRALRKYQFEFDENRQRYKDEPRHDQYSHGSDAYEILAQSWQSTIIQSNDLPPRFLHDMNAGEIFFPKTDSVRGRERI